MEFKNGFNFMYQRSKDIFASKIGRPSAEDEKVDLGLTDEEVKNVKLIYENVDGLVVSFKDIPTPEDIEITLTSRGEEVIGPSNSDVRVLTPFTMGLSVRGYDFGNVKNGDTNPDFDAFLFSLPENDQFILVGSDKDGAGLFAMNYMGQVALVLTFMSGGSGIPLIYYSTTDFDFGEFQATRGYQNLDDTGRAYSSCYTVDILNYGVEDTSWNGKFIGAIVDSRPSRFIPIKKGDKFINVHFDTTQAPTKDDFVVDQQANHIFVGTAGTWKWYYNNGSSTDEDAFVCWYYEAGAEIDTPSGKIVLEKPMFMITAINAQLVFYIDKNAAEYLKLTGIDLKAGWQGSTLKEVAQKFEVEKYLDPGAYGELINNILGPDYTGAWNGRFIGFTEDDYYVEPVETMNAFEVDMLFKGIPNMHFATSRKADILNMLQSLNYTSESGILAGRLIGVGAGSQLSGLYALLAFTIPEDNFYGLCVLDPTASSGMLPILGSKAYTWHYSPAPNYVFDLEFTGDFQNLDENGNNYAYQQLVTMIGDSVAIESIDDTGNWNGNLVGFVGDYDEGGSSEPDPEPQPDPEPEPEPEPSYDPITLEPFQLNKYLAGGSKIYFDRSKAAELEAFIRQQCESIGESYFRLLDCEYYGYGGKHVIFYITAYYRESDGYITVSCWNGYNANDNVVYDNLNGGWQYWSDPYVHAHALDEDGGYTIEQDPSYMQTQILEINDTNPPTWNGIIIGTKVEE